MGQTITLTASDGASISAYQASPTGTPKAGIVVIQEIFGVNSHIRSVADGYAAQGYLAIAPAFFDRAERGVELGYEQKDIEVGIGIARGKLDAAQTLLDIEAAAIAASAAGKVGVVGYCWGGLQTALAAIKLGGKVHACASYYGGGTPSLIGEQPVVPLIMHYGEKDHAIPLEEVEKLKAAWPKVGVFVYEGAEHGFNCDQRASFNNEVAAKALERTLEFFAQNLSS